jgi:predicted RNase H-like nuclease (RuvC/YqgF family)
MDTLDKIQTYISYIQKLEDKVIALADENRNLKNELESYKRKEITSCPIVDIK